MDLLTQPFEENKECFPLLTILSVHLVMLIHVPHLASHRKAIFLSFKTCLQIYSKSSEVLAWRSTNSVTSTETKSLISLFKLLMTEASTFRLFLSIKTREFNNKYCSQMNQHPRTQGKCFTQYFRFRKHLRPEAPDPLLLSPVNNK